MKHPGNLWSIINQQLTAFMSAQSTCEWCLGGLDSSQRFLCHNCQQQLPHNLLACSQCAEPVAVADMRRCGRCQRRPPAFDYASTAFTYEAPIDRWVLRCKDQHSLHWHDRLNQLTRSHFAPPTVMPDAVTFIPSSRYKRLRRGFNLSESLAASVALCIDRPLLSLFQLQAQQDQRGLSVAQRHANLQHSLQCLPPSALPDVSEFGHILVVDDIMTSGATMHRAAQLLKQSGVKLVGCWALARATKSRHAT